MFTKQSTLKEIYNSPVGHDVITTLLTQTGFPACAVLNPLVGRLSLARLQKLTGMPDAALTNALLKMLNAPDTPLPPAPDTPTPKWWKEAVVYQIYPRSFYDTNGDGIGDLAGIQKKLPYLKKLGVTMLWLSPIYDSPNDDCGYDIRDYQKILADFGTMEDFDALLAAAHKNGIKLIMDLVINHTSDEHAWFKKALKDANDPCHDYYIWRDGKGEDGMQPPNNWTSFFSGSAWRYFPKQKQFALHLFSEKQMDLNWENPNLRAELYKMVNWWLDKGVDGFRLDVISLISKESYADGSPQISAISSITGMERYFYGPRLHEYLRELRAETFAKHDAFTVGETPVVGMELARRLTAESRAELDTVFNFDHLDCPGKNRYKPYPYDLHYLKRYFLNWQQNYGNDVWMSLFFDNHDNPRMVGKIGADPQYHDRVAKLLCTLQMTLRGTPFVYQGDELGLGNAQFNSAEELRDVEAINRYNELLEQGTAPEAAFDAVKHGTRDHARTPMPWTRAKNAGFTTGEPWVKLTDGWETRNAAAQTREEDSVFHHYKRMIALRRQNKALVYGDFRPVFTRDSRYEDLFCYFRVAQGQRFYVEINLTNTAQARPAPLTPRQVLCVSNYAEPASLLRPYEANVYRIGGAK